MTDENMILKILEGQSAKGLQAMCHAKKLKSTGTKKTLASRLLAAAKWKVPVLADLKNFLEKDKAGKPQRAQANTHPFAFYWKNFNNVDRFDRLLYEIIWGHSHTWQQMYIKALLWIGVVNTYSLLCEVWSSARDPYKEDLQTFTENLCMLVLENMGQAEKKRKERKE